MGDTYGFTRIKKADLISGDMLKTSIEHEDDFWLDNNPIYQMFDDNNIGYELDRTYFLSSLLGYRAADRPVLFPELNGKKFDRFFANQQCFPISRQMVQNAINTLRELDEKINSLPHRPWPERGDFYMAGTVMKEYAGDYDYTEPAGHEVGENCVYYGRDAQDVAFVREVAKVYGSKYYKYRFPWQPGWDADWMGSSYVRRDLEMVLDIMNVDGNGEWLFLVYWW